MVFGVDPVTGIRSIRMRALPSVARAVALILGLGASACPAVSQPQTTLEKVRNRGYINCGVGNDIPGFSHVSQNGTWSGLDVEFCSALAAAVFGKKDAVKFRIIHAAGRFKALADGDIDVLTRATAWTLTRDTELNARFAGVLYYDGQGFLVPRSHSITSVLELSGASICVLPGSGGERAVMDYFSARKMRFQLVTSGSWDQLVEAYMAGGCTVLTGDASLLASVRSRMPNIAEHMILPELITKEPLGPSVKAGDDNWFSIVRWSLLALLLAEESGITSENSDTMKESPSLDVRRFLGLEADLGAPLGLARDWAYQIVKQVGCYADIFDRTLGQGSPIKLDRGLNNLWAKGGLMYAPPLR